MASVKLTNETRRKIRKRAVAHGFEKREATLKVVEHALAQKVYKRVYPEKVQALMYELPAGILGVSSRTYVYIEGQCITLDLPEARPVGRETERPSLDGNDKLGASILEWRRRVRDLAQAKSEADTQAWSVLSSVGTLAKLLQVWPEVEAFTTDIARNGPVTALAVPIERLNASLGLPPGKK